MTQIIIMLGAFAFLYNLFLISSSEALIGVNVRYAIPGEFRYIVSMGHKPSSGGNYMHVCTGSLVSNRDVLSAEHCVKHRAKEHLKMYVGHVNLLHASHFKVLWILTYDRWAMLNKLSRPFKRNDIAILRLEKNVTRRIVPGKIAELRNRQLVALDVIMAGWGRKDDNSTTKVLQTGAVRVLDHTECNKKMRYKNRTKERFDHNNFCTFMTPYLLSNIGDSGSPVLYYDEIIGITSGICPDAEPEHQVNFHLGIYNYRNFIYDVIENGYPATQGSKK